MAIEVNEGLLRAIALKDKTIPDGRSLAARGAYRNTARTADGALLWAQCQGSTLYSTSIDLAGEVLGKGEAAALVSLATRVAQVRAAQVEPAAAEGDASPLPPAMDLGTACNAHDLYELQSALTVTGSGREERLRGALASGEIADLRLVEAVLAGIGDS